MAKSKQAKYLERIMQKRFPHWIIDQNHFGQYLKITDLEDGHYTTVYHGKAFRDINSFILGACAAFDRLETPRKGQDDKISISN